MKKLLWILSFVLILSACGVSASGKEEKESVQSTGKTKIAGNANFQDSKSTDKTTTKDVSEIDLSLKPNEAGKVMVLMYHQIDSEEAEWVRTPDNFRKDLETLYEKGYRPISLTDYVNGNINIQEGLTPFVLTFDDGRENNFRYLEDGTIDPDCAVGILMKFAEKHPDFQPHATFFLNSGTPFEKAGEEKEKFDFLVKNGMDIGNHSLTHPDFTDYKADGLQEEIGGNADFLEGYFSKPYTVNTLALPFGSRPDESLYSYLQSGIYNGKSYENIAVLNVGWDPDYSPFHVDFNPMSIHRIRCSETNVEDVGIYNWLDYFDANPDLRYISDGKSDVITVPKDYESVVDIPNGMELNVY